jgi:ubiquinone/menaquinone biosynthesis C-methylase UbiE
VESHGQVADRATRDAWDTVAPDYARLLPDMTAEAPLDRGILSAFVQLCAEEAGGVVADVGCGAGRVTAHLAGCALRVVGVDLSPGMVSVARSLHPGLSLAVADAGALPFRTGALGGLLAWYSLINLPPRVLPGVLAEFARVTAPGAPLLLAFQSGQGERVDRASAYGRPVSMTYFRHRHEDVTGALVAAGFALYASVRREPALDHETTPQTFVLARRGC